MLNEFIELPSRSIVSLDSELLPNEQPPEVAYKGVTGLLLRRLANPSLMDLTMSEFNECLAVNAPEEEAL
tara:strand:- start:4175 stop:4384 length:210 start_codon:yes stop_codon:yes gene_type:complete